MKIYKFSQLFFFVVLTTACKNKNKHAVIEINNQFSTSINHYKNPEDSLKLKALYFIVNNMNNNYYLKGDWISAYEKSISLGDYSVSSLIKKLDSIKNIYSNHTDTIPDSKLINNSYLIANIDQAFNTRKYKWTKGVSFDDFLEYVLPYKLDNEKPESWRVWAINESYLNCDSLSKSSDILEVANYTNDHLKWYKGTVNYDYPIDLGYREARQIATGTCYSQSRILAYESRAIGLPMAIDYTPSWGNRYDGHYWNALIYKGMTYPIDPTGPGIGSYKIEYKGVDRMPYKISKVFRKMFSIQDSSLATLKDSSTTCPPIFNNLRMKDVTGNYVPVTDVSLVYHNTLKQKFAYLYTFNDKTWIPCFWGKVNRNRVEFKQMGRDIVYLPAIYININQIIPIGNPFILSRQGYAIELKARKSSPQILVVSRKYPEDETNKVVKGHIYELFFWDRDWKSLGTKIAESNQIVYNNVPTNALFWLKDHSGGKQERIFTYQNGQQIWW